MALKVVRKGEFDCSCYCDYPNINCKRKNHWTCAEDYVYVGTTPRGKTACKRIKKEDK